MPSNFLLYIPELTITATFFSEPYIYLTRVYEDCKVAVGSFYCLLLGLPWVV